jgi:hypothetical protein
LEGDELRICVKVKSKVDPVFNLLQYNEDDTYMEVVHLYAFLNSAVEGGQWQVPRFGRFTPGKRTLLYIVWEDG